MKTLNPQRSVALLIAALSTAATLAFGLGLSSQAADTSAKGAERLTRLSAPVLAPTTPARPKAPMHANCDSCTTVTSKRPVVGAKGAVSLTGRGPAMEMVSAHGCDGCSTALGVVGHGKAKKQVVNHECSKATLASVNCCR